MFKVHAITKKILKVKTVFQNISCLRFIFPCFITYANVTLFQNISCLRFIDGDTNLRASRTEFQNISCLRFMILLEMLLKKVMDFKTFHV